MSLTRPEESIEACTQPLAFRSLHFTLPYHQNPPPKSAKFFQVPLIATHIPSEFRTPVIDLRFWNMRIDTSFVLVPKAPSDFNGFPQA
jgi:hypothetical protein